MSIICMGDFGSGEDDQFTVAKLVETLIKKYDTKLILGLGDNFYPNGVTSIYDDKFLDQFELPYSNLPKAVKFYNVLGNHDYKGKIQPQIDYTQISKRWIMNNNWYYFNKTINKNTVRFYAIDTNLENLSEKMKMEQREGLIKSIKNSSAKWNILYGHHPYRSTGYHGNCSQELESFYNELINTGKIDIIISGHDHDQQLISIPDKPTMIVSGTGSSYRAVPKKFRKVNPDLKFYSEALGCCVLDFRLDTLTVRFFDDFARELFRFRV